MKHRVFKIVLTGGPCGGKTKSIPFLKEKLEAKGFKVLAVSEVARYLKSSGAKFADMPAYDYQIFVINRMLYNEDEVIRLTEYYDKDIVILYDRALLDNAAYVPYSDFLKLLESYNLTEESALARYHAVFHLVTAANGALEYYMSDPDRPETPEEACELDLATQKAWSNHPKHTIIDNSTNFDGKLNRLLDAVLEIVK